VVLELAERLRRLLSKTGSLGIDVVIQKIGKRSVGGKRRMSILNMGDNQNIENVAYYSI